MAKKNKKPADENPVEKAYKAGRNTITLEEGIGLPKEPVNADDAILQKIREWLETIKMAAQGKNYKPPKERK